MIKRASCIREMVLQAVFLALCTLWLARGRNLRSDCQSSTEPLDVESVCVRDGQGYRAGEEIRMLDIDLGIPSCTLKSLTCSPTGTFKLYEETGAYCWSMGCLYKRGKEEEVKFAWPDEKIAGDGICWEASDCTCKIEVREEVQLYEDLSSEGDLELSRYKVICGGEVYGVTEALDSYVSACFKPDGYCENRVQN